jgi:hypothetical protein
MRISQEKELAHMHLVKIQCTCLVIEYTKKTWQTPSPCSFVGVRVLLLSLMTTGVPVVAILNTFVHMMATVRTAVVMLLLVTIRRAAVIVVVMAILNTFVLMMATVRTAVVMLLLVTTRRAAVIVVVVATRRAAVVMRLATIGRTAVVMPMVSTRSPVRTDGGGIFTQWRRRLRWSNVLEGIVKIGSTK